MFVGRGGGEFDQSRASIVSLLLKRLSFSKMADCNGDSVREREQRLIYLVTYSRADFNKVPTREAFAEVLAQAWMEMTGVKIQQWVVAMEEHTTESDSSESNYHFHMAVKLERRTRWLRVRKFIDERFGMKVNFSSHHNTYYSAYKYTTKEDVDCVHSNGHPDLQNAAAPRTEGAITANKRKGKSASARRDTGNKRRKRGLSAYEVSEIIQAKKITSRIQLMAFASAQKREGKTDLAEFICNRGSKAVDDCLAVAMELASAEEKYSRSQKNRLELLQESNDSECVEGCGGKWIQAALDLLAKNEIDVAVFSSAVYTLLEQGRGKFRNIFLHGVANCGKTFLLSPLATIYNTFSNPATGTFAWVGVEDCEIILLNDFRWSQSIIAWADMLRLLEGDVVHLPCPKNFCKRDIELRKDTPVFATSDAPIVFVKGGGICHANTEMMNVRWRYFQFWRQIPPSEQQQVIPCGHCFAKLILEHANTHLTPRVP